MKDALTMRCGITKKQMFTHNKSRQYANLTAASRHYMCPFARQATLGI